MVVAGYYPIQKFDSDCTYITPWGSNGPGNGEFLGPNLIEVDSSGNVFVSYYSNYRLPKFSSTGTYITQWGSSGSGNGEFNATRGVGAEERGEGKEGSSGRSRYH